LHLLANIVEVPTPITEDKLEGDKLVQYAQNTEHNFRCWHKRQQQKKEPLLQLLTALLKEIMGTLFTFYLQMKVTEERR